MFGEGVPTVVPEQAEGANNATVLLGLVGDIPSTKFTFNFALTEPSIGYHEFDSDFGLTGSKLKKHIIKELKETHPNLKEDSVATLPTASGGTLTVMREEGLMMYDLLQ